MRYDIDYCYAQIEKGLQKDGDGYEALVYLDLLYQEATRLKRIVEEIEK